MLLSTTIKAAAFLLYPVAASSRSITPFPTTDSYATPEDFSVIAWGDEEKAFAKFHLPCHGCTRKDTDDALEFELSTGAINASCALSDVFLNGKELNQSWHSSNPSGAGVITAESLKGYGRQEVLARWHSLCIPPPSGSPTEDVHSALLLTVRIINLDAGFTVSFRQLGNPEILRLEPSPLPITGDHSSSELESWRDPPPSNRLQVQTITSPQNTGDSLEEVIEAEIEEFQELQFRARELQRLITEKENKIRKLLQQDCKSISSQVGKCDSFGCFFQTCFNAFPEIISRLRCRFGSLDSCLSRKPSLGCGGGIASENQAIGGPGGSHSEYPLNASHDYNASHGMGNHVGPDHDPSEATNTDPSYSSSSSSSAGTSYTDDYFHFDRSYLVLFVVLILSYCLFRRCLRACRSPRRRAEHAARREERRNRIAYRCAARRHRWRQWWNGPQPRNHESSSHQGSGHDLESGRNEAPRRQSTSDSSSIFEEGAMQSEILGLRRALEFVGDLVRPEDPEYDNQPRRYPRHVYERAGSPPTRPGSIAPPASSTAMLTTISSPRTSSLMSCDDTGSSVTLETLDPDPPEYRK